MKKIKLKDRGIVSGGFKRPTFLLCLITFGLIPVEFLHAYNNLQLPVNSMGELLSYKGHEIGVARNMAVKEALMRGADCPRYMFWMSDDELMPWDALIKLWMEMEDSWSRGRRGWDVVTGLVHVKSDPPEPVLWNAKIRSDGPLRPVVDYTPGSVVDSEVGDLGCGLMRMDVFERLQLAEPWFKTGFIETARPGGGVVVAKHTEDVWFFQQVLNRGGRIGVHTGVAVGHLDVKSGRVY